MSACRIADLPNFTELARAAYNVFYRCFYFNLERLHF